MQTMEPDHCRLRRRSLVSHMARNVNTQSKAIKARAMSRSWVSTEQLPRHATDFAGHAIDGTQRYVRCQSHQRSGGPLQLVRQLF